MRFSDRNSGETRYNHRARIIFAGLLLGLSFFLVLARGVWVMVIKGPEYREKARKQHTKIVTLSPRRGMILDRNGKVMAESVLIDSIYAHPPLLHDKSRWAKELAPALNMTEKELMALFDADKNFTWVRRFMSPAQAAAARDIVKAEHAIAREEKRDAGLVIVAEYARYYPQGRLAAQVIGFTGGDSGGGLEGLEERYNEYLVGSELKLAVERDARNYSLFQDPDAVPVSNGGKNIVTTLDVRVQAIVEEALDEVMKNASPQSAMAAVMDVKTGKILAMASSPTFNPNDFRSYEQSLFRNRVVGDIFEPGSTFKTFTLAAALDSGVLKSDDEFFCEDGAFELDGAIINDTSPHGWFTVEEIIVHSSNIGAAKIGLKLGRDRLDEYLHRFGFGKPVGNNFPAESAGIFWPMRKISKVGVANVAFGHGLAVTGLQLLAGINAIANKGEYVTPYIVEAAEQTNGSREEISKPELRRVMSEAAALEEARVLTNVVHGGGTGARAAPRGYTVAGKTGTAQKVNNAQGGYYEDKYVASFIGFAPAENPVISIIVVADDPQGEPWGGTVAAPAFREIVERTLPLLGILPASDTDLLKVIKKDMLAAPVASTETSSSTMEAKVSICTTCMPDLEGMSLREVMNMAVKANVKLEIAGSGMVVAQNPRPGSPMSGNEQWWIRLSPDPF